MVKDFMPLEGTQEDLQRAIVLLRLSYDSLAWGRPEERIIARDIEEFLKRFP